MKNKITLLACLLGTAAWAQIDVGGTVNSKANEKTAEAIDAIWNSGKKKDKKGKTDKADSGGSSSTSSSSGSGSGSGGDNSAAIKAYQNYDFVPGDVILFEDHFTSDQPGEFPAQWKLEGGQAVMNAAGEDRCMFITAFYSVFSPRMKQASYLPAQYTIEFDTWLDASYDSNEGVFLDFKNGGESVAILSTNRTYYELNFPGGKLRGLLPKEIADDNYFGKWHHIALAVNGKQMKVYCDQYRLLVVPDCNFQATNVAFCGNASEGKNMMFKDVRMASGGGMNMIGKKFTDTKIITHGITFDYNKATIKPESMGVLNMIVQVMKDNSELKFEVGGHTDSDGEDAYNLKLSQQRAETVKAQLEKMGVAAARLTAKGYGESKPAADNNTPEGKANNRRVEFVKI
jgi:outer membrane protein OmpA-like peptidoglycan-associated protein